MRLNDCNVATVARRRLFGLPMPHAREWWESLRWLLLVFTLMVAITLAGSFVSYERVVNLGHPWLPKQNCPGCLLCGMTRSFCAMSDGKWQQAAAWNRGGPALYAFFWLWLLGNLVYASSVARKFAQQKLASNK